MKNSGKVVSECPMPEPNPALRKLDKLVGIWNLKGYDNMGSEISGHEKYEWMDGGFFLKQEQEQNYSGLKIKSIQIIGFFRSWGNDNSANECTSHFFDSLGNSWEYVWEVDRNTITIWTGYIGSPAAYKGKFSENGNTLTGKWRWPGGGYSSILTRVGSVF